MSIKYTMTFFLAVALLIACNSGDSNENNEKNRWWTSEEQALVLSELDRTTREVEMEIVGLTDAQWNFKEAVDRWSIAEIVEHLEMQNQLHFRELSVTSKAPQHLGFRTITEGKDSYFTAYAKDPGKDKASWFLVPKGKFCSQEQATAAFFKARKELTQLVMETRIDFRKQFTFRKAVAGNEIAGFKIGEVRDLHQLLLTGIAHTERHLRQIRQLKQHPDYPVTFTE